MCSFRVMQIRMSDRRSLGSRCIKGTDKSTLVIDSLVPLMHHDLSDVGSLMVTVDLHGYHPGKSFCARCFKENLGKLYIIVKLITRESENDNIFCQICFVRYMQVFKHKMTVFANLNLLRRWWANKVCETFSIFLLFQGKSLLKFYNRKFFDCWFLAWVTSVRRRQVVVFRLKVNLLVLAIFKQRIPISGWFYNSG